MMFWHAISMVGLGKADDALPLLARAYQKNPGWRTLISRLPAAGLLPKDPKLLQKLQSPGM